MEQFKVISAIRTERRQPFYSDKASMSLIDERFDHDSCGVGFVASIHENGATHQILTQALTALARLEHRGATASDGKSSDGVGIMTAIPRALLGSAAGLHEAEYASFSVGMLFLPKEEVRAEAALERCLTAHGFAVLCWRDVPVDLECLGEIALSTMPLIRQVFVGDRQENGAANTNALLG